MKNGTTVKSMKTIFSFGLTLLCLACSSGWRSSPPDLPKLSMEKFLPAVRERIEKSYQAAHQSPDDPGAAGKLGMVLHAHKRLEPAEVCYRRARILDPDSFRWNYYLGMVRAAQGENEEAAEIFRFALGVDPNYLPAQLKLGECLLESTHWEAGEKLYAELAKQHPRNAQAHNGLGRRNPHSDSEEQPKCAALPPQRGQSCLRLTRQGKRHRFSGEGEAQNGNSV